MNFADFLPYIGALFLILVLGLIVIAHKGIVEAAKGVPIGALNLLFGAGDAAEPQIESWVKSTETTIDDVAYEELHKAYEKLKADVRAGRTIPTSEVQAAVIGAVKADKG
jgi:hypothetical protein